MIQRVNGTKLMVKVLQHPTYEEVLAAQTEGRSVELHTASYANCIESTGTFELVDIGAVRGSSDAFRFNGRVIGMDVDVHPDEEARSIVFVKSGLAKVVIDNDGADIEFTVNLSLCVA